jgi:hypothetical protein
MGLVPEVFWWTPPLPGVNRAVRGKHRTEVTEVTEGGWVRAGSFLVDAAASGREPDGTGKASHGGHRGHGGGMGLVPEVFW